MNFAVVLVPHNSRIALKWAWPHSPVQIGPGILYRNSLAPNHWQDREALELLRSKARGATFGSTALNFKTLACNTPNISQEFETETHATFWLYMDYSHIVPSCSFYRKGNFRMCRCRRIWILSLKSRRLWMKFRQTIAREIDGNSAGVDWTRKSFLTDDDMDIWRAQRRRAGTQLGKKVRVFRIRSTWAFPLVNSFKYLACHWTKNIVWAVTYFSLPTSNMPFLKDSPKFVFASAKELLCSSAETLSSSLFVETCWNVETPDVANTPKFQTFLHITLLESIFDIHM